MKIKAGNKFMCIKDVVMHNGDNTAYYANKVYWSEIDGCITDEQGEKYHYWIESDKPDTYFKPYVEKPLYWFVGNKKNGEMLLREMERLTGARSNNERESESGENLFFYDTRNGSIAITHNNGVIAEMIKENGEEVHLPKRWRAEKGEEYWSICSNGILRKLVEFRSVGDEALYAVGNYFQTEEECAKGAEEYKKLLNALHDDEIIRHK